MQNIFTNIKYSEIILYNANENWYIILYDLFSRLCYIATCGPFCKDATHMEDNGLFYNDQFGFKPGHFTELASVRFVDTTDGQF